MTAGKVNTIVASSLFILMLAIYLLTAAPTISFWDCGEFVTCSYIMGIPHPPGSPLLSLIGRVMSIIPFYDFRGYGIGEIGYRVTLIDVVLGALIVMLTYLVMVRLIHRFRPYTGNRLDEAVVMFCSAVTALVAGFADEFWNNAVEIETYVPGLFMSMLCVWLTLRWEELKDDPAAVRYLFLAAYILGLGNGVHLTVLLVAPTVFLLVLFAKPGWFSDPKLWLSGIVFLTAFVLVKIYGGLSELYLFLVVFAFVAPVIIYRLYRAGSEVWKIVFLTMMLCFSLFIIGYSVYPTVMVRAQKKPAINEGNPDNWRRYTLYMEREQYGQENMYVGMFTRKADSYYQFGFMYLRYLIQQFPKWGPTFPVVFENSRTPDGTDETTPLRYTVHVSVLLVSLILYGLYTHGSEDWRSALPLIVFFLVSSVGLVLYLNMENPQVRERSYFFLGSFYIIMVWLGMGVYGVMMDILGWLREKGRSRFVVPTAIALFTVFSTLPPVAVFSNHIDPGYTNYEVHDRTKDWAPYDYGYNILASCESDAILFTNGDNDTFPLWYLQEVEGFRKDVRVVNLSLLNTDWYILQMKYEGKTIPIEYSDDFVENVLCGRDDRALMQRLWPAKGKEITAAGITWNLAPIVVYNDEQGMLRTQEVMVTNIIKWVNWTRPIYFAVTVADENKAGLQDYLAMEGMVYRLVNTKAAPNESLVNVPELHRNVFEVYQYHSLSDPTIYKPPNTLKLTTNYFIGFAQLAERYAAMNDRENAVLACRGAIEKAPNDLGKRLLLYQVLTTNKMYEDAREFLNREISKESFISGKEGTLDERLKTAAFLKFAGEKAKVDSVVTWERARLRLDTLEEQYGFGAQLLELTLYDQAYDFFNDLVMKEPDNPRLREMLITALFATGRYKEALESADKLVETYPNDENAKKTRDVIRQLMQSRRQQDSLSVKIEKRTDER